jgi:hypothetical protein
VSDHADAIGFGVCDDDYRRSPSDEERLMLLYDSCSYLKDSWIFVR